MFNFIYRDSIDLTTNPNARNLKLRKLKILTLKTIKSSNLKKSGFEIVKFDILSVIYLCKKWRKIDKRSIYKLEMICKEKREFKLKIEGCKKRTETGRRDANERNRTWTNLNSMNKLFIGYKI